MTLRTFNKFKTILWNCASDDKQLDIAVFNGLIKELKTNIKIAMCETGSKLVKHKG